jgi:PIN domain nuclease of toxin-antitoxin system
MRLLLDTHTFLWFVDDNAALSQTAKQLIEDPDNEILLSVANLWEMAIKVSLGKLTVNQPFDTYMTHHLSVNAIALLNISIEHAAAVVMLPFHHRDPFDRLLIAQVIVEQIPILSGDEAFDAYNIQRLW